MSRILLSGGIFQGEAPPFIILTLAAGMMAVTAAQVSYIAGHGLSRQVVFSVSFSRWFWKVNCFTQSMFTFVIYLSAQLLQLVNILHNQHALDRWIMAIFIAGNGSLISWITWLITYRVEDVPEPAQDHR